MSQLTINIGTVANDGTGHSLRDAFNIANINFGELYAAFQIGTFSFVAGNVVTLGRDSGSVNVATDVAIEATNLVALDAVSIELTAPTITLTGDVGLAGNLDVDTSGGRVAADVLRIKTDFTPTDTTDTTGQTGDLARDDDFIYVKTSAGWKRAALSTF